MSGVRRRNLVLEGLQSVGPKAIEPTPQLPEPLRIDVIHAACSLGSMRDEPGTLQRLEVLRHRRTAHRETAGECADRTRTCTQALEDLPQSSREVLILREFEGMSYREISEVTGMAPGTVMSRLSRARSGLRQALTSRVDADILPRPPRIPTLSA